MKRFLLICLLCSASPLMLAAEAPPEAGLRAEMAGNWQEAARIYSESLAAEPARSDLWQRLAEVQARLKQPAAVVVSLEKATSLQPQDAALWMKLSRARAVAGDAAAALAAANKAQALAPENLEILRARAELASWAKDQATARTAYEQILALTVNDAEASLGLARLDAWSGNTDAAVAHYKRYLAQKPEDRAVWLDLIKTEGWRGNYPDALDQLETYRQRFGEDRGWQEQRARALAWLGKTRPALAIIEPMLAAEPDNVDLLTTRAIALQAANRQREALEVLERIRALRLDSPETADLSRYLKTPQRSSVTLGFHYARDTDAVRIARLTLDGEYVINPEDRLWAGTEGQRLRADPGSGLENVSSASDADYRNVWIGGQHRFSPEVAVDAKVGGATTSGSNQTAILRAGLDLRPSDEWWWRPELSRDFFAVSPRAASLGIKQDALSLQGRWLPDNRYVVEAFSAVSHFSDGNQRWELSLAPRRAFWRTQDFNVDLGLSARWFGFRDDLDHGYYDPQLYQRYAITDFNYWKINDNNGLSLALSFGIYRDNTMSSFKFGGDAVVQGFFGIYGDWYLRVYTSLLHNVRQSSGAYRGNAAGIMLTRRF